MRIFINEPVREDSFSATGAGLTGVLLSFRSGACYAFSRYVFFGLEFYLSGIYTAGEDAGRPIFQNRGGAIGRMPIAPVFMGAAQELFFGETWRGLLLEREAVARQVAATENSAAGSPGRTIPTIWSSSHRHTLRRDDKTWHGRILLGDSVDASRAALHISALFCDFYWSSG